MFNLLIAAVMYVLPASGKTSLTPVETCVWPHTCVAVSSQTYTVEPCVWPNTCAKRS